MKTTPKIEALQKQIATGKMQTDAAYILDKIIEYTNIHYKGIMIPTLEHFFTIKNISGRLSDLEDMGLIYKNGRQEIEHLQQSYSLYFYEPSPEKQAERRAKKHLEKYRQCANRLINEFGDMMSQNLIKELKSSLNVQTNLFD